jgi:hypothetical protein
VGADSPTVGPLLSSFTSKGGGSAAVAKAAAGLLNGVITDAYFTPESNVSSPWVQVEKKLLSKYAPSLYAKYGLDGNTQYGVALAYTFVQALQAAGKNLTRAGLVSAIQKSGKTFATPGLSPLSYGGNSHFGFEGAEVIKLSTSAPPAVTPTGSWMGSTPVTGVEVTNDGAGPIHSAPSKPSTPPHKLVATS